jgi:hypothetical protein
MLSTIVEASDAGVRLRLEKTGGHRVEIEASSDLVHWFPLVISPGGHDDFDFVDPWSDSVSARFYRGHAVPFQ